MLIRTRGNNDGNKHLDWLSGKVKVFLDGKEVPYAIEADTSKGYVIEHYKAPTGDFAISDDTRRIEGHVTLVIEGDVNA